jgi:hypothetical protein
MSTWLGVKFESHQEQEGKKMVADNTGVRTNTHLNARSITAPSANREWYGSMRRSAVVPLVDVSRLTGYRSSPNRGLGRAPSGVSVICCYRFGNEKAWGESALGVAQCPSPHQSAWLSGKRLIFMVISGSKGFTLSGYISLEKAHKIKNHR